MPSVPTRATLYANENGVLTQHGLVYKDANGSLAHVVTPLVVTQSGLLLFAPTDANNNPQVSLAGSNALLGEYSFAYASGAAASTVVNESVPLPAQYQASALYLVTISNPASLGTALTVTFQNGISVNGTLTQATVTTLTIASGVTQSYLVQGILLGDGAGQVSVSNSVATAAAGTAYVQVRRP